MKRFFVGLFAFGLVVIIALAVAVFVIRGRLASEWPDDPGPLELPHEVAFDPAATEAVHALLELENLGLASGESGEFRVRVDELYDAPRPTLGSAIPEPAPPVAPGGTVGEAPPAGEVPPGSEAPPVALPPSMPGPGPGVWDEVPELLARYSALAEHGLFDLPIPFDEDIPFFEVLTATKVIALRARASLSRGHADEAAADYIMGLEVAGRFQDSGSPLITPMIGIAAEGILLRDITALAAEFGPGERQALMDTLAGRNERPNPVGVALVYEGREQERVVRELLGEEIEAVTSVEAGPTLPGIPLFDLDATIAMIRWQFTQIVEQAGRPPSERERPFELPDLTEPFGWRLHNPMGRIFTSIAMPGFSQYVDRADALRATRGLVILRLAIASYESANGSAPPSLDALVPGFLTALPEDPFDFVEGGEPGYVYTPAESSLRGDCAAIVNDCVADVRW